VRDLSGFLPKLVKGVLYILSENVTHRHVTEVTDLAVDEPLANVSEEAADVHSKRPYGDCSRIVPEWWATRPFDESSF
jgi:hypothetical protein